MLDHLGLGVRGQRSPSRRMGPLRLIILLIMLHLSLGFTPLSSVIRCRTFLSSAMRSSSSSSATTAATASMVVKTRKWVHEWVANYGLCPWAASMLVGERMRISVMEAKAGLASNVVDNMIEEARLLCTKKSLMETTLIVCPHEELRDYHTYLDVVYDFETALKKNGMDKRVQVASFHPDYVFADTPEESPENYTNRSPFPIVHLLLVDKVTEAITSYCEGGKTTEAIWERNIALMHELGIDKISHIHSSINDDSVM